MTVTAPVTPFRAGSEPGIQPHAALPLISFSSPHVLLADVSEFQPDVADAAYLAWSPAIVIRCAYGDAHDDKAWYGGQRRALLHSGGAKFVGIYQYLVAGQNPSAQAQAFHRIVGNLKPGEVAIADYEEGPHSLLTGWYNEMLALGYDRRYLWTYSGLNFGQANGVLPVEWLAAYRSAEPSSPHRLWQFSSSFAVPGVGTCDCSVFHGTIGQLAALAVPAATASTYAAPTGLSVTAGHTSFRATWTPPAHPGLPAPAGYWVYVYEDANLARKVDSYPRRYVQPGYQGGGLKRHTRYLIRVVTVGENGTRTRPGTYAQATFTTG